MKELWVIFFNKISATYTITITLSIKEKEYILYKLLHKEKEKQMKSYQGRAIDWSIKDRERLQILCREGFTIARIVEVFDVSRVVINKELQRGLTEEEWSERRYVKYSIKNAILSEAKEKLGEEKFEYLINIKEHGDE